MSLDSSATSQTESLQAALACLDLSLDLELALYRRQNLQISSALALSEHSDDPSNRFETNPQDNSLANLDDINRPQSFSSKTDDPQEAGLVALSAPTTSQDIVIDEVQGAEEQGELQKSGATKRKAASFVDVVEEDPETLPEPYSADAVSKPEALERFLDPSIEDYLESSEALLKHLDHSEGVITKATKPTRATRLTAKPSPKKSLPTTSTWTFKLLLGVLAMAMLVGIAMLILKQLTTRSRNTPVPQPSGQSSIQPSVQTTLAPVSASPSMLAVTPLPLKETPKPTSTSASLPNPAVQPSAFYVVVAPYQDDASLQRARQLVPDAFIANIKGQRLIQLAFLDELQRAQRLVNDLKNEGFPAKIMSQN